MISRLIIGVGRPSRTIRVCARAWAKHSTTSYLFGLFFAQFEEIKSLFHLKHLHLFLYKGFLYQIFYPMAIVFFQYKKNGAWECWNVSEKENTEIGDVDKTY